MVGFMVMKTRRFVELPQELYIRGNLKIEMNHSGGTAHFFHLNRKFQIHRIVREHTSKDAGAASAKGKSAKPKKMEMAMARSLSSSQSPHSLYPVWVALALLLSVPVCERRRSQLHQALRTCCDERGLTLRVWLPVCDPPPCP